MPGIFPDNFIFKYFVQLATSINTLKSRVQTVYTNLWF